VAGAYWHNVHTPLWTHTEDAMPYTFQYFGLYGLHQVWPFYIDRQTTQCSYHGGVMEVAVPNPVAIEFDLGSNVLAAPPTTPWRLQVYIESIPPGSPTLLATYQNTSADLAAGAPTPYWSRKHLAVPAGMQFGNRTIRFRRDSPTIPSGGSPYVYVDDLVVWREMLPNQ
jgi:hypothetical protein